MVRAIRGVLVTVEPAIKSLILHIDSGTNDIIIEDLDETHLLIKESMLPVLKKKLDEDYPVAPDTKDYWSWDRFRAGHRVEAEKI